MSEQIIYINRFRNQGLLPETQAIITRALSESFAIPDNSTIKKLDKLIRDMKSVGYWEKRDYILLSGYNDINLLNFSRINIKNPSWDLATLVGDITYTLGGFKGSDDNTSYLSLPYNYLTDSILYTLDDAGRDMVVYQEPTVGTYLESSTMNNREILRYHTSSNNQRINQLVANLEGGFINTLGTGYKGINRTSSEDVVMFNKDVQYNRTRTSVELTNGTIRLFLNSSESTDAVISYYSIGASVVDESQDFRTIYNQFLTRIGLSPIA